VREKKRASEQEIERERERERERRRRLSDVLHYEGVGKKRMLMILN
jgi:hypothetical protein